MNQHIQYIVDAARARVAELKSHKKKRKTKAELWLIEAMKAWDELPSPRPPT